MSTAFRRNWRRKSIVRCIEGCCRASLAGLTLLAGCSASPGGPTSASTPPAATARTAAAGVTHAPAQMPAARPPPAGSPLPAPHAVRSWTEVQLQAAQRLVSANPHTTYTGPVPDPLLAIPVLEIELNRDGSVHRI